MVTLTHFTIAMIPLLVLATSLTMFVISTADATGGAGQIAEMVMSKLNDALTYLEEGDNAAATKEINDAIKELMDTYEADKEQ